jgi:NADP-dependent 3-hydroxy acid dehydrogenase YdfG
MLLEGLARDGLPIAQVLHMWTYAAYDRAPADPTAIDQGLELGFYSLLFLTQALAQAHTPDRLLYLDVVASCAQATADADLVAGERSAVVGLVKTLPQELPWLNCRHIDLPIAPAATNVAHVLREVNNRQKEREVAYRDGARLVARLERADLRRAPARELPFTAGGVYLLSGGLGGIGARLATYLREQHDARLILVGRTPLDGPGEAAAERARIWQELRQHGNTVIYEAVDICDLDALRAVVARASARWLRPLDGVIHLAGSYHERLLADETREGCEAILRPKLSGTWALGQLLAERSDAVLLAFSSANSLFGGFGVGAYAAANNGLEGFVQAHRSAGHPRSYCYAWSIWEEIGISRSLQMKDLARARGYAAISPAQGLLSLLAALHHGQTELVIGLDGSRPHIRRLDVDAEPRSRRLWAYVVGDGRAAAVPAELAVYDRFQSRSACASVSLAALPRTPDGRIDHQALKAPGDARQARASAYVAPQSALERLIAAIWQGILGVEQVGTHDNFFDLGGQSLLMVQVQGKLRAALNRDLSMVDMFRYPTVSAMAGYLGTLEEAPNAQVSDQKRAQRQRAAIERQKQLARAKRGRDE